MGLNGSLGVRYTMLSYPFAILREDNLSVMETLQIVWNVPGIVRFKCHFCNVRGPF